LSTCTKTDKGRSHLASEEEREREQKRKRKRREEERRRGEKRREEERREEKRREEKREEKRKKEKRNACSDLRKTRNNFNSYTKQQQEITFFTWEKFEDFKKLLSLHTTPQKSKGKKGPS